MDKIKCIKADNGAIIPIHQIAYIAPPNCCHYIWTSADTYGSNYNRGHKLSEEEYNKLLNELEII